MLQKSEVLDWALQKTHRAPAMIRIASMVINAIATIGAVWLLLAVFAACVKFY